MVLAEIPIKITKGQISQTVVCRVPTIRENQGKIFSSGKSGKVRESQGISIFFVESQGKSGNFDLAQVNQIWSCISRHIFAKPCVYRYKIFPRFARMFIRYLSDSCRQVRESQAK